jgi:hypothetical protein
MANVIFVAPFFLETTLRFVDAAASLAGVRLGLISQDPLEKLPPGLRSKLAAHARVEDSLDPDSILDGIGQIEASLGSVERLLGTLEELQVPLGELRDRLDLPGMRAEAAANFRDKARMKTVLQNHGLPCARHRLAGDLEEALTFSRETGFPLVVKPPAGSGARGTGRVESEPELLEALRLMPPTPERPALLEEFIVGEEHSFDSICLDGRIVWYSVSDYSPGPLEVLQEPWIQWTVLLPRDIDAPRYEGIRVVAQPALQALGIGTGLSHMEWFHRPDRSVAISEVGARPPGAQFTSLISWANDFDLYSAWADLSVYDRFEPGPHPFAAGAAYLRGQGRGRVQAVRGLEEIQRELGSLVVEARLPREGQPASGTYEGEGFIILRHPDTAVVEEGLARIVSRVRVELG